MVAELLELFNERNLADIVIRLNDRIIRIEAHGNSARTLRKRADFVMEKLTEARDRRLGINQKKRGAK